MAWLRDGVPISLEGQRRIRVATADNILQIQGDLVFTVLFEEGFAFSLGFLIQRYFNFVSARSFPISLSSLLS